MEKGVFVHATAEVSPKAKIGKGTKVWHQAQVREGVVVGRNCVIAKNVYLDKGVKIGNGVKIQNNVNIYGAVIGDEVMIGPNTSFTNDLYPRAFIWNEKKRSKPIVVGRGASIGANSTVIGGVKIGEYALVGAGSVVTKDVPAHALVYGNPARVKGFVCRKAEKMIKESEAGDWVWLKCPECREKVKVEKSVFEARECY